MDTTTERIHPHAASCTTRHPSRSGSRRLLAEIFGPVGAPYGSFDRRLLLVRSAVAYAGLLTTLVQVVVWLVIALLTTNLDSPWWLWTTVPAAALVTVLSLVQRWHLWWQPAGATPEEGR